ncbi:MAG: hypothetical protein P9L99_18210 [Candidatus Lernaella stagnicola]|nr:hypothetical protein [Candidatus Lernaella stagnicola]
MAQASAKLKNNAGNGEMSKEQILLDALEQAAAAVGVVVRYDKLATGDIKSTSGVCRIRGVDTIIVDRRLSIKERVAALARELSTFRFDDVFLPPAIRELLEPVEPNGQERKNDEKAGT